MEADNFYDDFPYFENYKWLQLVGPVEIPWDKNYWFNNSSSYKIAIDSDNRKIKEENLVITKS